MVAALGGTTVLFDVVLGRNGSQKGPGSWRLESQRDKAGGELQAIDRCDGVCG